MQAKIKSITLESFKGVKQAHYIFDEKSATVTGCNGAGKTTLFTAWMWLCIDKDAELHSNPSIQPLGVEEATPRVELVLDVDGKEITAAKIQKRTVKKSKTGGADTVSISNVYEVNSVECGERDFKKKMQSYGFDFDLFLPLSHPDAFTGQKAADMRKVLFGMVSEKTDKEIADMTKGAEIVADMLSDYTMEEIRAMQNATLRKIKEVYGKDGEIIRAQIEGMEKTKTDIDAKELELKRGQLIDQIFENRAKQEDISKEFEEQNKIENDIFNLRAELGRLQRDANRENFKKRDDLNDFISSNQPKKEQVKEKILDIKDKIRFAERVIGEDDSLEKCREEYRLAYKRQFDESSTICPYCKQEFPAEKKEQLRTDFENHKEKELWEIAERGTSLKERSVNAKKDLERLKEELKKLCGELAEVEKTISEQEEERDKIPWTADISNREDVKEIQKQIEEKEALLKRDNGPDEIRQQLRVEADSLQEQMNTINEQFALVKKNTETDQEIADLRKQQRQYEQQKCDAERIIDQLDLVSKEKNEMLTDSINKNFDIVRWQLFEYQKNGEYKNCCVPLIDGKRFRESTNTGLEILAKLDIIKGLQRFYGRSYPVFIDGAECLSEETKNLINANCQIIYLTVSEDKDLRIEVM